MKNLWIPLLFVPSLAFAVNWPETPCKDTVRSQLKSWHTRATGSAIFPSKSYDLAYRFPTSTIGQWVDIEVSKKETLIKKYSRKRIQQVTINHNSCIPNVKNKSLGTISSSDNMFTDIDLEQLMKSQSSGLLYFWSPQMPLSLSSYKYFKWAADKLKIKVTTLLDPMANPEIAKRLARKHGLPLSKQVDSLELAFRNFQVHYPTMLYFSKGQFQDRVMGGARTKEEYENLLVSVVNGATRKPSSAQARSKPLNKIIQECPEDPSTYRKLIKIKDHYPDGIGYFQQPISPGRFISFNMSDHGAIFDLKKGISVSSIVYEPFPTPDGRFITSGSPLRFILVKDLVEHGKDEVEAKGRVYFQDRSMGGWYQSVGVVNEDTKNRIVTYRALTANSQGVMRDYKVKFTKDWIPLEFIPVQPKPIKLCKEQRRTRLGWPSFDFQMPIISKDGSELSTLSPSKSNPKQTMKFWKINPETGECTEAGDLGTKASKGNFSFDGRYFAFTTGDSSLDPERFNNDKDYLKNNYIYVFDRQTGISTRLAQNLKGHNVGFYPGFLPDDRVVYKAFIKGKLYIVIEDFKKMCQKK